MEGWRIKGAMWLALTLSACGGDRHDPQRLIATGQIIADADQSTVTLPTQIDRYRIDFIVAGPTGDVEITRMFSEAADGGSILVDDDGWFEVDATDLALSYEWQRDELVCGDVCTAWETFCDTISEEVCESTCYEESCGDICWDECTTECYEETVCDDYDCWTETVCEDVCVEVCDFVCETISYACDCYIDTYDQCAEECVEFVEECDWVTRTYASQAELHEVVSTYASIRVDGIDAPVIGETLEARQHEGCNREGECEALNLWVQKDRFSLPALDD